MAASVSVSMRLREFFEAHYVPHCIEDPQRTALEGYRRALTLWETHTSDPPLAEISSSTLSEFKARLCAMPWRGRTLSINTVRKHLAHVQWILDQAGPPGPRSRRSAAGILAVVAYTKPPRRQHTHRAMAPAAAIVALYGVLDQARLPQIDGIRPGAFWRALIATACSTSLRIGQLNRCPMAALQLEQGRLLLPADTNRKSRRDEVHPLHPFAQARLMAIRGDRQRLFPMWPRPHAKNTIYDELHRLQGIAGTALFGFHDIRRHMITVLSEISPAAAQLAAGHESYKTTQIYQDISLLEGAVRQLGLFDQLEGAG